MTRSERIEQAARALVDAFDRTDSPSWYERRTRAIRALRSALSSPADPTECEACEERREVNGAGLCSDCAAEQAYADAHPETPEQRAARVDTWFCKEPGCDVLGRDHAGPHAKVVCLGDVDRLEWTRPGAYLDALRPLSLASPADPVTPSPDQAPPAGEPGTMCGCGKPSSHDGGCVPGGWQTSPPPSEDAECPECGGDGRCRCCTGCIMDCPRCGGTGRTT